MSAAWRLGRWAAGFSKAATYWTLLSLCLGAELCLKFAGACCRCSAAGWGAARHWMLLLLCLLLGPVCLQALVAAEAELAETQQALDAPVPAEELHRAMEVAQVREGSA